MITLDIWFIGMIILVILQQTVIIWLTRKVIKYGENSILRFNDSGSYTCNDRNNL